MHRSSYTHSRFSQCILLLILLLSLTLTVHAEEYEAVDCLGSDVISPNSQEARREKRLDAEARSHGIDRQCYELRTEKPADSLFEIEECLLLSSTYGCLEDEKEYFDLTLLELVQSVSFKLSQAQLLLNQGNPGNLILISQILNEVSAQLLLFKNVQ